MGTSCFVLIQQESKTPVTELAKDALFGDGIVSSHGRAVARITKKRVRLSLSYAVAFP